MTLTQDRKAEQNLINVVDEEWTPEWQAQAVHAAAALLRAVRDGGEEAFVLQAVQLNQNVPQ